MTRIKALLKNGTEEDFPDYVLDHLIKKREIVAFLRSDGWVYIDRDPIRTNPPSGPFLAIPKRRSDYTIKKRFTDLIPGDHLRYSPDLFAPEEAS